MKRIIPAAGFIISFYLFWLAIFRFEKLVPIHLGLVTPQLFLFALAYLWLGDQDFMLTPRFGLIICGVLWGLVASAVLVSLLGIFWGLVCVAFGGFAGDSECTNWNWVATLSFIGLAVVLSVIRHRIKRSLAPIYRGPAPERQARLAQEIRARLDDARGPELSRELGRLLSQFLRMGGSLDIFSDEEAVSIVEAAAQELGPAFWKHVPAEKIVALAGRTLERGQPKLALALLTDEALAACAGRPGDCLAAADILEKSVGLANFIDRRFPAMPRSFQDVFTDCLNTLGKHKETLEALRRLRDLTPDQRVLLFEANIRCGHFSSAQWFPEELTLRKPAASNPEFYYALARICEDAGQTGLSRNLYRLLTGSGARYKDSDARLVRLTE